MNIFNFIRNKTKAFPTLITDFSKEHTFLNLRNFIGDGHIFKYIDKDEPENIEKLMSLEAILNARPKTGIVDVRYLKESNRLIFAVGECFDNIKTLTEILKLPQGPENYLERVRLRKEYIDSKLKENPSEVFWDYPDYFGGTPDKDKNQRHPLQTLKNLKINTNGIIVSSFNNVIGLFRDGKNPEGRRKNYIDIKAEIIDVSGVIKIRSIRRSRLVACTFVKMSDVLEGMFKTNPEIDIVPDHLDMDKQNDNYLNFEWTTRTVNTIRGKEGTGQIKYYLIEIVKGNRKGEKFYVHGVDEAIKAGLTKDSLRRGISKNGSLGVKVEIIKQVHVSNFKSGFDDPSYFDQFKKPEMIGKNTPTQYYFTPVFGPFKGIEYKVTGKTLECVLKRKRFRIQRLTTISMGCTWRYEDDLKPIDNIPDSYLKWLETNRNTIISSDMLVAVREYNSNDQWKITTLYELLEKADNRRKITDGIRSGRYFNIEYKKVTLDEARALDFEY